MIFELSCVTKLPNCSPIITCQFKGPISESNIAFKALHISDSDLNSCPRRWTLGLKHHGKRQRLRRIGLAHRRTKIEQKQTTTTISKLKPTPLRCWLMMSFIRTIALSVSVSFISQKLMFVYSTSSFAAIVRGVVWGVRSCCSVFSLVCRGLFWTDVNKDTLSISASPTSYPLSINMANKY